MSQHGQTHFKNLAAFVNKHWHETSIFETMIKIQCDTEFEHCVHNPSAKVKQSLSKNIELKSILWIL